MKNLFLICIGLVISFKLSGQDAFISVQPTLQGGFVCYDGTATITATASNTETYNLQINDGGNWNNFGASGSGNAISISVSHFIYDNDFRISVTNTTTNEVNVSNVIHIIGQRPNLTIQPIDQIQCYGQDVFYYVNGGYTSYEWQKSETVDGSYAALSAGSKYKNVGTEALKLDGVKTTDNDFFRCKVADANGCEALSNAGGLAINYMGTLQPTTTIPLCEGQALDFYPGSIDGTATSYTWEYTTLANAVIPVSESSIFENANSGRLTVNELPGDFENIDLEITYTNNLMSAGGGLLTGSCSYKRNRDGYRINSQPASPSSIASDSTCGIGGVTLEITDVNSDWDWSVTKGGSAIAQSKMLSTTIVSSSYFYVQRKDGNGCTTKPDSVLAKVNPLPSSTIGTVLGLCTGATSFSLPFTSVLNGGDKFSLSKTAGNVGFTTINNAALIASPMSIPLTSGALSGDNNFDLVLKNSNTGCESSDLPFNLHVDLPTVVVTPPGSAMICEGDNHTLQVAGTGQGTLSYQWFFEGEAILNATLSSLMINEAAISDAGAYHCIITALCGSATSSTANFTVNPKTRLGTQPQNAAVCRGSQATFSVMASGAGTLSYQWKMNGANIGTDASFLVISNVILADNSAKITCLVSGDCGDSLSSEAILTVYDLPLAPSVVDTGYCLNSSPELLKAIASIGNTISSYGALATGGTDLGSILPSTSSVGSANYFFSQTDARNCESERVPLVITTSPEVTSNLSSSTAMVCGFGNLNITVLLSVAGGAGNETYTYQWGKNAADISEEVGTEYRGMGGGDYYVKTRSGYCEVQKSVTVNETSGTGSAPTVSSNIPLNGLKVCPGLGLTLTALSTSGGSAYMWYKTVDGSTAFSNSNILSFTNIQSSSSYFAGVQQDFGLLTCESERREVTVGTLSKPAITAVLNPETCPGLNDGSIALTPVGGLTLLYQIDDGSIIIGNTFSGLAPNTYKIGIIDSGGTNKCRADTNFTIGATPAPIFTSQPQIQNNCYGNTVTFETTTDGTYTMQWEQKLPVGNWEFITGENALDLRRTGVGTSSKPNGTYYRLKATSGACTTVSDSAKLEVNEFTENLDNQSTCVGDLVTFSPPTPSGQIVSYQWQKDSGSGYNIVQDGTSPDFLINAAATSYSGDVYRVRITFDRKDGSTCVETSDPGTLTVMEVDATTLSGDIDICAGESSLLTATGCNGIVTWSNTETGESITVSPNVNTIYTAVCGVGSCSKAATNSLAINVKPGIAMGLISVTNASYCFGDSAVLTGSGCSSGILWSTSETTKTIVVMGVGEQTYSMRCMTDGCTSSPTETVTTTGNLELVVGQISTFADTNCAGYNPGTISSMTDPSGGKGTLTVSWEIAENCTASPPTWNIIIGEIGLSFNPSALQQTTCYRRKVVDECDVILYSNISVINIVEDPSILLATSTPLICSNAAFTLTGTVSGGTGTCTTSWQKNLKSSASGSSFWEAIAGSTFINSISDLSNASADTTSVYFRMIYDCDLTNCNKATSDAIEIKVLPSSRLGLNLSDSTVCAGNTITLIANSCGGVLTWNDGSTDATRNITVTASAIYTATCSSTCGTFTATATISAIPGIVLPISNTPASVVTPATLQFDAIGTDLKWYSSETINTPLIGAPSESAIGEYGYWVTQSTGFCESPRLEIKGTVYSPLTITQQPADQYDCDGNSVNFASSATGVGSLSYQWERKRPGETNFTFLKDENDGIKFSTNSFLRVSAVGDKDNPNLSQYRVLISDSLGSVNSEIKTLYANVLDGNLPSLKTCQGQNLQLNLNAFIKVSGDVFSYQWQVRDDGISKWIDLLDDFWVSGTNSPVLQFTDIQTVHSRKYRIRVSFNTGGYMCSENSDQSVITVGTYPNRAPDLTVDYCQGKTTKTLSFNAKPNKDIWFISDGDNSVGSTKNPKPSSELAGIFNYWFASITSEGCVGEKAKYTVAIHSEPEAPKSLTPELVQEGDTLVFDALGSDLKWYSSGTGRKFQLVRPAYTAIDEYSHYVSQTSAAGCEGERTYIKAEIQGSLGFIAPMIDKADCEGNSVRFVSNGKGIAPLTYVWERKVSGDSLFRVIEGEGEDDLLVSNIGSSNNPHLTAFRVTVKDITGDSTSNVAQLFVNEIKGKLKDQSLCGSDSWRVNLEGTTIQGMVRSFQLQLQVGSSWVGMDTTSIVNTIYGKSYLEFHDLKNSIDNDSDYRIRIEFEAEKGGTCARSTNEFEFNLTDRPASPNRYLVEMCQYTPNLGSVLDTDSLRYFSGILDSTAITDIEAINLDKPGASTYWFAKRDTLSGCLSTKDTLVVNVLPADSILLSVSEYAFCTADTVTFLQLDEVLTYQWFEKDSVMTALGDSLFVNRLTELQKEYAFQATYENGCKSPISKISVKVESCEDETVSEVFNEVSLSSLETGVNCGTYPNPSRARDEINLDLQGIEPEYLKVYNSLGLLVWEQKVEENKVVRKLALDSDLPEGFYILRITGKNGNHCEWKMVKSP